MKIDSRLTEIIHHAFKGDGCTISALGNMTQSFLNIIDDFSVKKTNNSHIEPALQFIHHISTTQTLNQLAKNVLHNLIVSLFKLKSLFQLQDHAILDKQEFQELHAFTDVCWLKVGSFITSNKEHIQNLINYHYQYLELNDYDETLSLTYARLIYTINPETSTFDALFANIDWSIYHNHSIVDFNCCVVNPSLNCAFDPDAFENILIDRKHSRLLCVMSHLANENQSIILSDILLFEIQYYLIIVDVNSSLNGLECHFATLAEGVIQSAISRLKLACLMEAIETKNPIMIASISNLISSVLGQKHNAENLELIINYIKRNIEKKTTICVALVHALSEYLPNESSLIRFIIQYKATHLKSVMLCLSSIAEYQAIPKFDVISNNAIINALGVKIWKTLDMDTLSLKSDAYVNIIALQAIEETELSKAQTSKLVEVLLESYTKLKFSNFKYLHV